MSVVHHQTQIRLFERTRRMVVILAAVPASLLVVGLLVPPRRPVDVIAVVTLGIWLIVYPGLLLAGFLVPLFLRPVLSLVSITLNRCYYRMVRATFFSLAALVVTVDYWLFGVLAGLKWLKWELFMIDVVCAITAIVLVLIQIPLRVELKQ